MARFLKSDDSKRLELLSGGMDELGKNYPCKSGINKCDILASFISSRFGRDTVCVSACVATHICTCVCHENQKELPS